MVIGPPAPNALAETELQIASTRSATSVRRPRQEHWRTRKPPSVTLHDTYRQTPKPIVSRRSSPVGTNFVINDNPVNPTWEDELQSAGIAQFSVHRSIRVRTK
ncbi:hypothetical protein PISMIDRAFT_681605 [Pisolithus microcarpus 441]|uniref:Uncharacterized protein n=1 Tax=Pisolithus microcarpus 441 TaxID=765257 RepID=A0A0C9ZFG4_9AGAM|nr:hypothetical protein BKA83DRAFT_681605 [Pisolithus microcarpus]KIK21212.1 hypothetical protein PISMIDRAFT_681605 [Pisolithus microcarpus 441]